MLQARIYRPYAPEEGSYCYGGSLCRNSLTSEVGSSACTFVDVLAQGMTNLST